MMRSDSGTENVSKLGKINSEKELGSDVVTKEECAPATSSSSETEKDCGSMTPEEKTLPEESGTFVQPSATAVAMSMPGQGRRASSYELRCVPVNILFKPSPSEVASILSDDILESSRRQGAIGKTDLLHRLCLRPGYSLKTQMMLSFGMINLVTIVFIVMTCIVLTMFAGDGVYSDSEATFTRLGIETQGQTSRYLAEALSPRLMPLDVLNFLHEAALDRFAGHPDQSDSHVPFEDMLTGTNMYPVTAAPMPLEWQITPMVGPHNFEEHLQSRWAYYQSRPINTVHASYHFQGICNPNATESSQPGFWESCTESNNQLSNGGVVAPANLTAMLHRKASDLVPLFRLLFETREEVRDMGLYFSNDGAGSSMTYPHYTFLPNSTYVSTGCEWMKTPHPYNKSRTIGTQDMINNCHDEGTVVDVREYNPMEREWCVSQALNPAEPVASVGKDAWNNEHWLMFLGKALYDRVTTDFIGCTYVGISLRLLDQELKKARVTPLSHIAISTWDADGIVVASSGQADGKESRDVSVYNSDIGVTKEFFDDILNLVDYDSVWDPVEVREKYEKFTRRQSRFFVSSYPIPSLPNEYDPTYRPYYLLFSAIAEDDVFRELEGVGEIVDERVSSVTLFAITVGAVGFLVSTLVIALMANMLTAPLRSMNEVAQEIVYNFGDPTKEQIIDESTGQVSKEARCTPRTELSDVVKEFNKLVKSFSGSSMARSEKGKHTEVENLFTLTRAFSDLYSHRRDEGFNYSIEPANSDIHDFIHLGSNLGDCATNATSHRTSKPSKPRGNFSPLFVWTVVLIVTPLLITSVIISAASMVAVKNGFTEGLDDAKFYFVEFQVNALSVHAKLRADLVSETTSRSTHDLHVLTRYAEWLLFGALERTDSFTTMATGLEPCKTYENPRDCPFAIENDECDCTASGLSVCSRRDRRSRYTQSTHLSIESFGAAEDGDRNSTGYPEVSFSPETTAWWENIEDLPGWEIGSSATGHSSSYDRIRVISALPILQAIFNYDPLGTAKMADYVAFEADGAFYGYDSLCNWASGHLTAIYWESTEENGAARLRPELCPLGKFGYDPRCRGWYDTGRRLAMNNGTSLHITSPYLFAGGDVFAQSATEPLIDPRSGEHIGQTIIDFQANDVYAVLSNEMTPLFDGGFPILITTQGENNRDSVVAPGFALGEDAEPIAKLLLPTEFDCPKSECSSRLSSFEKILSSMKAGESDVRRFERKDENGVAEMVYLAYVPVTVRNMESINSSDYTRGVATSRYQVYVLGLGGTESGILEPFNDVEEATQKQIRVAIGIVSALLCVAAVFVAFISHYLTKSITEPMLYLLDLIRSVNRHGADQDPPDLKTVNASKEIVTFSYTMEMLYKALRSANAAFYAGALEAAYLVLVDSLRLFKRLDNKKAIGIASNNLGNTMLAIYREMELEGLEEIAGLSKKKVVKKGIAYFHEAIQLGETAYDGFYNEQGWSPICLDFMQHLANRYFNRALFLLTVKKSHESPGECERLGRRDLEIARDMDLEVIAYGEEIGWGSDDRPEKLFDVKLVRLRGYNILLSLGYPDEWETEELFDEAFDIIRTEAQRESSDLFAAISIAGRLQEIETELMKFKMHKGEIETAAKIAIRMLREDEKVFIDAEAEAVDVLLKYLSSNEEDDKSGSELKKELEEYREMLEDMVDDRKQAAIEDLESDAALSRSKCGSDRLERGVSTSWALASSSGRFVTMENF